MWQTERLHDDLSSNGFLTEFLTSESWRASCTSLLGLWRCWVAVESLYLDSISLWNASRLPVKLTPFEGDEKVSGMLGKIGYIWKSRMKLTNSVSAFRSLSQSILKQLTGQAHNIRQGFQDTSCSYTDIYDRKEKNRWNNRSMAFAPFFIFIWAQWGQ